MGYIVSKLAIEDFIPGNMCPFPAEAGQAVKIRFYEYDFHSCYIGEIDGR